MKLIYYKIDFQPFYLLKINPDSSPTPKIQKTLKNIFQQNQQELKNDKAKKYLIQRSIHDFFMLIIQNSFLSPISRIYKLFQRTREMSRRNRTDLYHSDEQAEEVREQVEIDEGPLDPSEQSGEDLMEEAERDYERMEELDNYEPESVDVERYELNPEARRKAENQLDKRQKIRQQQDLDDLYDEEEDYREQIRRKRMFYENDREENEVQDDHEFIDAEECMGRLCEWINMDKTKRFIKRKFGKFLTEYAPGPDHLERIYFKKVQEMLTENRQSIQISYLHFKEFNSTLAVWLGLEPSHLIPELNTILYAHLIKKSSHYKEMVSEVFVKFLEMPIYDKIRELRYVHIGKLINVKGVVTVRGESLSQMVKVIYKCIRCGETKGPFYIHNRSGSNLGSCRSCQSSAFAMEKSRCLYQNYQRITVQQSHSDVDAGRIPRTKQVLLYGDNVDVLKPGDEAQIVGTFLTRQEANMNIRQGYPVFTTFIEANSIVKLNELNFFSAIEQSRFIQFSKIPNLKSVIYNSLAPSIYGHYEIKQSIAFALFGGTQKFDEKKMHRTRGDINVLLIGDPGIAKSQFLKSIQKSFHRVVYATGQGASAVGLTASVKQDHQTGEWRLEAGAMVQADRGICLIDEFDKMNDHDRTSIHEAMEQQTISISKAGIVAQLRARCSVIAAANPLQGRYNNSLSFADNVNLSDPILSRFDIVKVMRDVPNEVVDRNLSTFVINSHMENHPYQQQFQQKDRAYLRSSQTSQQKNLVPPQFLKQYIKYVRDKFSTTRINDKCSDLIRQFYNKLRASSAESGGIVVTPRHLQSMIRICESHAKMHLRQEPIREDAEIAMRSMLKSYIETQKYGPAKRIQKQFIAYL